MQECLNSYFEHKTIEKLEKNHSSDALNGIKPASSCKKAMSKRSKCK
jgi:hypothetical protein